MSFQTCVLQIHSSSEHKLRYFWWNPRALSKAQKGSKDIVKIVHVTSVVQPQFYTEENTLLKSLFVFSLCTKSFLVASSNYGWSTDVTWTILTMSLLPFWALNMWVLLLSMEGQKAFGFHEKYLNLCSEDEWMSYGFGMTWHFWVNYPFKRYCPLK